MASREQVKYIMEQKFKPAYQKSEAIPMSSLADLINESGLPPEQTQRLLNQADLDGDRMITYLELENQLYREAPTTLQKLGRGKRVLNSAIRWVAPVRSMPRNVLEKRRTIGDQDEADAIGWGEMEVDNYVEAYDCKPPPFFIPLITLAEIAAFIYYTVMLKKQDREVTWTYGCDDDSPLIYDPSRREQVWRFVTYSLIHCGYQHIIFNCIMQLLLGTLLETVHKYWRVGLVYILGILGGSLGHSLFDPTKKLAGASGGCYALIGAHFASVLMNWSEMQSGYKKNVANFFSSALFRLLIILLLAGGDTGMAVYQRYFTEAGSNTGISAHLGGLLCGVLIGVPVLRNLEVRDWENVCRWVCVALYIILVIGAIVFNCICKNYGLC